MSDEFEQTPAAPVPGVEGIGKAGLIEAGKFSVDTFHGRTSFGSGDKEKKGMAFVIGLGAGEIEIERVEKSFIRQAVEEGEGIIPADENPDERSGWQNVLQVAKEGLSFLGAFGGRDGPPRGEGVGEEKKGERRNGSQERSGCEETAGD